MQKITPFLWFNDQAEEAAKFYVSLFKGARTKITNVTRRGAKGPVLTVTFVLDGQTFLALNGGPHYQLTAAYSMYVDCKTQKEVDTLWKVLARGGSNQRCGWVTDKFGLTWQIIPSGFGPLLHGGSPKQSQAVMAAMMKMKKLDLAKLQRAYARAAE